MNLSRGGCGGVKKDQLKRGGVIGNKSIAANNMGGVVETNKYKSLFDSSWKHYY
jgi:hypothetical protein